ncbi:ATP-binding cassette domain-containing protein [Lapidilactobacillus mulanensis]|uniref:ATP-binding cassette domain-containing protein n=1 Tax=Lapidilactobacillus mulanensis TaxID=2485999 RepID=A0ABW4DL87_9LACO|nr:ABC transporter ATP-binding protein [Lapidilactobacillus mulanensis]
MKLAIKDLSKAFDDQVILKDTSYTFESGKIYGLLGRNGAGKTTLFNCIAKDMKWNSGEILLGEDDQSLGDYDPLNIGYVYATPHLPSFMTGLEFITYFMEVNHGRLRDPNISATSYLNQVGLDQAAQTRLLRDYSTGMKNKVQMLVSLIVSPPVLLLDEPLTSFDPVAAKQMKDFIISLKKDTIIIFSTHILQLAQEMCDEIVLLHQQQLHPVTASDIHTANFEAEVVEMLSSGENTDEN